MEKTGQACQMQNPVRVVTATSLFDGHDAAINIIRRILQDTGVEVIHLGHNRSVTEIVDAALEEDVQGVAVSCYQGGHIEFFKYLTNSTQFQPPLFFWSLIRLINHSWKLKKVRKFHLTITHADKKATFIPFTGQSY